MSDDIQIRDLIALFQQADPDEYVCFRTKSADSHDRHQLRIHSEISRAGSRLWALTVEEPEPDEQALIKAEDKGYGEGFQEAKSSAYNVCEKLNANDAMLTAIQDLKNPNE